MKNYQKANDLKDIGIKPHQIAFATTSELDYEMSRTIILEDVKDMDGHRYLVLEGYHCSCYDFDESQWEGTLYTTEELITLINNSHRRKHKFWQEVLSKIS